MKQSVFHITKMDCPTEEQLIRNRLKAVEGIDGLAFDLMRRELTVTHRLDDDRAILSALESIGMDPRIKGEEAAEAHAEAEGAAPVPRATWIAMAVSGA